MGRENTVVEIRNNERVDDLQFKGLKVIQNPEYFCFGIDAVLLSHFVKAGENEKVADLGAGTGILSILTAGKTCACKITGIEIQDCMVDMAKRSIKLNNLEGRVEIIKGDIREISGFMEGNTWDVVVSNPPYKKAGSGLINPCDQKALSRHEIKCSLEDVVNASRFLLKHGGRLYMVHRSYRLVDVMYAMRTCRIEPKRLLMVHPCKGKNASMFIVEGMKGGNPELTLLDSIYIYDENGNYTEQILRIYNRGDSSAG